MGYISEILLNSQLWANADYIAAFFLIFGITYGILSKSKVFNKNSVNAVVALSIAFIVSTSIISINVFKEYLPRSTSLLLVILGAMMAAGLIMGDISQMMGKEWIGFFIFVGVLIYGLGFISPSLSSSSTGFYLDEQDLSIIILVLLIIGVIVALYKTSKSQ